MRLNVGAGGIGIDPIAKRKRTPHDPPHEQWLARLDVGAGSIGVDPITKIKNNTS